MAGFLYFIPAEANMTAFRGAETYAGLSLRDTFRKLTPEVTWTVVGPSGCCGWLLRSGGHSGDRPFIYDGREQVWGRQSPEDYWVGHWRDALPTPDELRHVGGLRGYQIPLGDEQVWEIPLALVSEDARPKCHLPMRRTINDAGEWVDGDPVAAYAHLLNEVRPFFDAWHEAVTTCLENGADSYLVECLDMDERAVRLLACNYRVWRREIAMLGLLVDRQTSRTILEVACDCPTALDWLIKKKRPLESVGSSSSVG